jgi:hypothetical protein
VNVRDGACKRKRNDECHIRHVVAVIGCEVLCNHPTHCTLSHLSNSLCKLESYIQMHS